MFSMSDLSKKIQNELVNDKEIIKLIESATSSFNVKQREISTDKYNLLELACLYVRPALVEFLLKNGADANEVNPHSGLTPLLLLIRETWNSKKYSNYFEILDHLKDYKANLNAKEEKGSKRTAMHLAVIYMKGKKELDSVGINLVLWLITNGCDINAGNINNETPLYFAKNKDQDLVELLQSFGASERANGVEVPDMQTVQTPQRVTMQTLFSQKDEDGSMRLHRAADQEEGNFELFFNMQYFNKESGLDSIVSGSILDRFGVRNLSLKTVRGEETRARSTINELDANGNSLVHIILLSKNLKPETKLRRLRDACLKIKEINLNIRNKDGFTALHLFLQNQELKAELDLLEMYINKEANFSITDPKGVTGFKMLADILSQNPQLNNQFRMEERFKKFRENYWSNLFGDEMQVDSKQEAPKPNLFASSTSNVKLKVDTVTKPLQQSIEKGNKMMTVMWAKKIDAGNAAAIEEFFKDKTSVTESPLWKEIVMPRFEELRNAQAAAAKLT